MDYETLRPLLIVPHGVLGSTVLLSGVIALGTKKGGRAHKRAGAVFYWGMLLAIAFAMPLMIMRDNVLLLLLSPLSAYLVIAGRRAVVRRRRKQARLSSFDRALALLVLAGSLGLAGFGGLLALRGSGFAPVAIVLGLLGAKLAWDDWARRNDDAPEKKRWLADHIGMMCGGFIAASTAFSAVNLQALPIPPWIVWLWPTAAIVPMIVWFSRKYAA